VEEITGLPVLDIKIDKAEIARRGLSLAAVQDAIGTAIGGHEAGLVFEGDRRFQIIVRLSDSVRENPELLQNIPVTLSGSGSGAAATVPLGRLASFHISEGPNQISRENGKRRVVVTANARGRDIGSLVAEAQAEIERGVPLPAGYWIAGADNSKISRRLAPG